MGCVTRADRISRWIAPLAVRYSRFVTDLQSHRRQVANLPHRVITPLRDVLHRESTAGMLLVIAAAAAVVWANSPFSDSYDSFWNAEIALDVGGHTLGMELRHWVNDLAMVLFFFVAGLEIKREITHGELRDPKHASLPIAGAIGGMVVPALLFTALNAGGDGSRGWGIPMATDIAIVMGVVALIGTRAPAWIKLFLLALAIVDDIGAIVVIAVFYSEGVSFTWLAIAAAALLAALAIRSRVGWIGAYVALGGLCWFALHEAHVHPTLAGVAFGLASPVTPRRTQLMVDAVEVPDDVDYATAWDLTKRARESVSVVEWLQHRLHPWSAFLVVPAFALANAGVPVSGESIREAVSADVTWGIVLGLVVGKAVGITAATRLAVALGIGRLPSGMTWRYVIGAGMLGGIGFTVSLFVTELAFGDSTLAEDARLAVLFASLVAGVIGCAIVLPGRVGDRLEDAISSGYES